MVQERHNKKDLIAKKKNRLTISGLYVIQIKMLYIHYGKHNYIYFTHIDSFESLHLTSELGL